MTPTTTTMLWLLPLAVVALNLPFGFWRAGTRRFSVQWFLAVHAPVPLVIALRLASGLGWQFGTVALSVAAFFTGQFFGGRIRGWWAGREKGPRRLF